MYVEANERVNTFLTLNPEIDDLKNLSNKLKDYLQITKGKDWTLKFNTRISTSWMATEPEILCVSWSLKI